LLQHHFKDGKRAVNSISATNPIIVADCHVHYYPCYDWLTFLSRLRENLSRLHPQAVQAAFLTEGSAYNYFNDIKDGHMLDAGGRIEIPTEGEKTVCLRFAVAAPPLFLFAGRQIITRERLEILALVVNHPIPDHMPAIETVAAVQAVGGIPVLPWAPGKWTLRRKKTVKALLCAYDPGGLYLGDSSLRPARMPESKLMQWAISEGFGVLAGSDPLPVKGEEHYAGSYGVQLTGPLDARHPARSICKVIQETIVPIPTVGRRCSLPDVARRIGRHEWTKRVPPNKSSL
jgi:hypothetical protein